MGKLQFIQEAVSELERHYRLAEDQFTQPGESLNAKNGETGSYKSSTSNSDGPPPVIPTSQYETLEDGTVINKRFKPLTYSLMSWVKGYMGLRDTIDISEDENYGQFEISSPAPDEDYEYTCYFNTDEINGLIGFYVYHFRDTIPKEKASIIKDLALEKNLECISGQVQIVTTSSSDMVARYYAGIIVKGIASDDPNYSGNSKSAPSYTKTCLVRELAS